MRRRGKPFSGKPKELQSGKARLRRIESLEPRQLLNAAPVANDDAYSVAEDTVLSGASSLLANDTDADNDLLTAALVSGPQHGTLNLKLDGTFTYSPHANFAGADSFIYAAMDGQGGEDKATVTITVIGENEPPIVNNQTFGMAENSANGTTVGTVVATDPDAGDVLTYALSNSGGAFAIDNTGKITVANNSKLDFETQPTINLFVTVSDNEGASDTATIILNVTNANDPPTVVAPAADVSVAEESSPTVINVSGVFADQDQDALSFSVQSDNPALVTPSISGSNLTLTYNANKFGAANITLTAHDGKGGTANDTFIVNVANVNDPPIANDDVFGALAGNSITSNVLANDIDPDGDTMTAFLNSATKGGTLSFQSNGTFTYTPDAKFAGADTFTYTATDGKGSDTATVTINVTRPNHVPDAKDDSFTTPHNTNVSANVLANDTDADDDKLFATLVNSPANGNVVLNFDGSFSYLPNGGFVGTDSFTYKASDGLDADTATVTITVTLPAVLDASDDHFTRPEDIVVIGNLLANDIDPEGDKVSLTSTSAPSSGSLVTDPSGNFTYTPLPNFFGTDSFTYTIQDTNGSTATATVTLTFNAVNDIDAVNDAYAGKANTTLTIAAPGVRANDFDPDINQEHQSPISGVIPASGTTLRGSTFNIRADGSFDFTPGVNVFGADSFTYTIEDGAGAKDTATVTINIDQPNHAPDAKNDNVTVGQDSAENFIAVLANDTDFDGNQLFVAGVTTPANGTVTIVPGNAQTGGGIRYTPNPGFRGTDSFTYVVSDGLGGSDNATVVVTVAPPVNPDASDDFFTQSEDTVLFGNLLANDFDLEGDTLFLVSATAPSSGSLIANSAGNFSYTPSSNFVGDASFAYTITDGNGTTDTASVTIRVTNINDAPDAKDDQFTALPDTSTNVNVLANDVDFDLANPVHAKFNTDPPDALRVVAVGTAANGQVVLGPGGVISYIPNDGFAGTDSFTYTVSDRGQDGVEGTPDDKTDTAKVTVTVPGTFGVDASKDSFAVNEDTIRNALDVLKNDVDPEGGSFKVTSVTQAAKGIVEIGTNGANVLYTPDPNFAGADTFTYTITDSTGAQDSAKVTVQVINANDPPDAKNDTTTVSEGSKNNVINELANDVDIDGDKLTVTNVTQGTGGTVTIGADGANMTYTPNPGFAGSDLFTYTITDPDGGTDTATVLVIVSGRFAFGSEGDDVFYVRRNATGTNVQVFANDAASGAPIFEAPIATAPMLPFDTLAGDDRLIVDWVNGNPIPPQGISFSGGANGTVGDRLSLRNGNNSEVIYTPSGITSGNGVVTVSDRHIALTGVEPIDASAFTSFTVVTPNPNDTLTITRPAADVTGLAGTSGGVAISPVSLTNVSSLVIDAATGDVGLGDDALTINASRTVPNNDGFLAYHSGTGNNSLELHNGTTRIDSTITGGGTLNTTVATGAKLITHRLRQNELVLGDGASALILQDGSSTATSVVTKLTIGTGATLDITDNALVIDYSGASPEATIRAKILEGRGGPGFGASWTGAGITSSTVATANATAPESQSVGYAENAALPLGAYTTFRGQAVDATAVLIAATRTGDANLDGVVADDDVTIIGASYAPGVPRPQWALGDFDFNGFVDDDDVTLLGAFYDPAASPLAPPAAPQGEDSAGNDELIDDLTRWLVNQTESASASHVHSAESIGRRSRVTDRLWAQW